jgi:protocatechuate 3,4-dioxygenase beta subunit
MSARAAAVVLAIVVALGAITVAQQPQTPVRDVPRDKIVTGNGVISGTVRAADTGVPIRGADIRLTGALQGSGLGVRGAFTDANGRYEFTGLADGAYQLVASKVRYMTLSYGQTRAGEEGRAVQMAGGQRVENIDFALPAGGVIVLRIGNRFGDAAVGYRVSLFQAKAGSSPRVLTQLNAGGFNTTTDDRGEIRLSGLAPGDYFVSAEAASAPPGTPGEREGQTFFPGTPVEAEAQPITVGLGEEVVYAFDTTLSRTYRISGTIVSNETAVDLQVERVTPGRTIMLGFDLIMNKSFSRSNLAPGQYILTAKNPKELGTLRVDIGSADVSDLVLAMKPVQPIYGRVTFEGEAPRGVVQATFVVRPALENDRIAAIAQYKKADWTFEIPALAGSGVITADLPRGWFLKAVRLEGRDVTDTLLDFETYHGKAVEVLVTQTATDISGRVTDASGRAVTNYVAVAFADDPQRWTPLSRHIASVRSDQQGRFSVRGLPPGRYRVAAVDYLPSGLERDPKILERLRGSALAVTLSEGATQNVTVTLTP